MPALGEVAQDPGAAFGDVGALRHERKENVRAVRASKLFFTSRRFAGEVKVGIKVQAPSVRRRPDGSRTSPCAAGLRPVLDPLERQRLRAAVD